MDGAVSSEMFWHFNKDHVEQVYERSLNFDISVNPNSTIRTGLAYKNKKPFTGIYVHSPMNKYTWSFYINGLMRREGDLPTSYTKFNSTIDGLAVYEYRWEKSDQAYKACCFHRTTGPAAIMIIGYPEISRLNFWYINGLNLTTEINKWTEENGINVNSLTEEDRQFIKMKWDT